MTRPLVTKAVAIVALSTALLVSLVGPPAAAESATGGCSGSKPIVISSAKINNQGCSFDLEWTCPTTCTLHFTASIKGTGAVGMTLTAIGHTSSCTAGPDVNAACVASVDLGGFLGGGFDQGSTSCGPIETVALLVEFTCGVTALPG